MARIWKAIQDLDSGAAAQAANVAAEKAAEGAPSTLAQKGTRRKHAANDGEPARKPSFTAAVAAKAAKPLT